MTIQKQETITAITAAAQRFRTWCTRDALPLWATSGRNPAGGFYEHLLMDGQPDRDANVRIRVAARQTYAYAHASVLGWYDDGANVADDGLAFMQAHCMVEPGFDGSNSYPGLGYVLSPDHRIVDDRVDLYTQAFFLLAMAWHHRAQPGGPALAMAHRACEMLDERMASPHGGWIESIPDVLPRRQNPHMHLFEAFMALYQASGEAFFLDRADRVFALFDNHFLERKSGVLLEFFTPDWQPDHAKGTLIEPGHMVEWCWLLSVYASLKGMDLSAEMHLLYDQAIQRGTNGRTGLLWDEMTIAGEVTQRAHRSWSLTEYLKASVALGRLGDEAAAARIPGLVDLIFAAYLDTGLPGGWFDRRDGDGNVISNNMPSSTFYHYLCACAELDSFATSLTEEV